MSVDEIREAKDELIKMSNDDILKESCMRCERRH